MWSLGVRVSVCLCVYCVCAVLCVCVCVLGLRPTPVQLMYIDIISSQERASLKYLMAFLIHKTYLFIDRSTRCQSARIA